MTSHITRRVGDRAKRIACHWSRKCRCLLPYAAICMIFAAALTLIAPCSASVRFCTGVRGRYIIGTASRRAGGVRGASRGSRGEPDCGRDGPQRELVQRVGTGGWGVDRASSGRLKHRAILGVGDQSTAHCSLGTPVTQIDTDDSLSGVSPKFGSRGSRGPPLPM